jgi:predicted hydrocarbon binding protein
MQTHKISLLKQREIEANIAAAFIDGYAEEIGRKKAMKIAADVIQNLARDAGMQMSKLRGGNTISELAATVRGIWSDDQALEVEMLEESESKLFFNVTRCRFAELYGKLGLKDFGYCFSCNRDGAFIQGFNPQIKLKRTKTIMEGAPFCDFRFERK